ncbi:MAG: response regulator [Oscillospiraceae bacterium]|jgi:DNA-binding NarL/FixJ family response regulator
MKLMLVDDHPLFLEGLQYLLETYGITVAGVANNGREALLKARIIRPEIILMDIKMPVCGGLDALRLIKAEIPEIKIIMLTMSDEDEDLLQAVRYGASGYLLKNINADELIDALNDIEKGYVNLSPDFAAKLFSGYKNESGDTAASSDIKADELTGRQLEVLKMAARGIPYKDIGKALGLSERTIKYHMGRILELLHLENRAQVIAYAAKMGLVEDEEEKR